MIRNVLPGFVMLRVLHDEAAKLWKRGEGDPDGHENGENPEEVTQPEGGW